MQVTSLTPSQLSISNTRIVSEPPLQRSCLVLSVKLFVPLLLVRASLRLTLSLLSVSFFFRCRPKRAGLPLSPRSLFLSPGLCWRGVTLHSLSLSCLLRGLGPRRNPGPKACPTTVRKSRYWPPLHFGRVPRCSGPPPSWICLC